MEYFSFTVFFLISKGLECPLQMESHLSPTVHLAGDKPLLSQAVGSGWKHKAADTGGGNGIPS